MSTTPSTTEMDKLNALMAKEALAAEKSSENSKVEYYRMKKAKEYAQAYVFVKDFRAELLEAEPDLKITESLLAEKLNQLWSSKSANKAEREV